MDMRRGTASWGLALLGLLALSACGGDMESKGDEGSTRVTPPEEAAPVEQTPDPAPEAPTLEPAATPENAPAISPSRPAPRAPQPNAPLEPKERVIPVEAKVPDPVDPRPVLSEEPRRELRTLAAGHTLELNVDAEVSTESARPGDAFYATVGDDVLGSSGEVLLPRGTRFKGRVLDSRESQGSDQPAVLTVEFESVTVNGAVRPLRATVVEMDVRADARDSNSTTAAKVGAGAAAGALVGRILGRDRGSAVKGAVVGAVAGTAAAMATRSGHATVEQGARIVIRLDQELVIDG